MIHIGNLTELKDQTLLKSELQKAMDAKVFIIKIHKLYVNDLL